MDKMSRLLPFRKLTKTGEGVSCTGRKKEEEGCKTWEVEQKTRKIVHRLVEG
jgi:hypothetical protein